MGVSDGNVSLATLPTLCAVLTSTRGPQTPSACTCTGYTFAWCGSAEAVVRDSAYTAATCPIATCCTEAACMHACMRKHNGPYRRCCRGDCISRTIVTAQELTSIALLCSASAHDVAGARRPGGRRSTAAEQLRNLMCCCAGLASPRYSAACSHARPFMHAPGRDPGRRQSKRLLDFVRKAQLPVAMHPLPRPTRQRSSHHDKALSSSSRIQAWM